MLLPRCCSIVLVVAATLGVGVLAGCSDDPSRDPSGGGNGTTTAPDPLPPPPNSCDVPEPPAPLGRDAVVGTGTPESCTEDALRAAVAEGGNITFDCGGEATIAIGPEILLDSDTIIDGAGEITLDSGGSGRILHTAARVVLTVQGLSFVNGVATSTDGEPASGGAIRAGWLSVLYVFDCVFGNNHAATDGIEGGGAIYQSNGGELTVVRSTFSGNSAISGGAIDNLLAPMTLVGSSFVDNESFAGGGAVYDDGASESIDDAEGGTISICGCRFERNRTIGQGGAVYLWAYAPDELIINQCSFVQNEVRRGDGSALGGAIRTGNAPLALANSVFTENHADVHGGAYWTDGEYPVSITNCTFYANDAGVVGGDGSGYGGAISGFNMAMRNLTFVGNHAVFTGGAISNEEQDFTLDNSIFLDNTADNEWGLSQTCAHGMPGDHNIQWPPPEDQEHDPLCSAGIILEDPLLGELSDNGGPTLTIPLLAGSPAIDAADGCTDTDQRGEPRQGPCDIGAFELQ